MRAVTGVVVGLVAGFIATIVVGVIGVGATASLPPGIKASDTQQVIEAVAAMPTASKIALMTAWFAGSLIGALVAKLIVRKAWAAWTVAGLVAAYVLFNTFVLPLQAWMQVLSIVAPLVGGLIGNHLVAARAAIQPEAAVTTDAA